MYASARRVVGHNGAERVDAAMLRNEEGWARLEDEGLPVTPSQAPPVGERVLGALVPGERVAAYLEVEAPNEAGAEGIRDAVDSLWLHLLANEVESSSGDLPNPLALCLGRLTVRFGMAQGVAGLRSVEMAALWGALEPTVLGSVELNSK